MGNIFIAAGAYAATLIGAGFASGQEIVSFFVRYGKMSFFSLILAAALLGVFAAAVMGECAELGIKSYGGYLSRFMGKKLCKASEAMTLFFAVSVFCVMAACCGEMGNALFGIKNVYGALFMCVLCGAVMMFKTDSALNLNAAIGAVIVVSIITCTLYILRYREHQAFADGAKMLVSGVSYSGYNVLTAGVILAQLSARLRNRREAYLAAFAAAFSVFVIMALIWGLLSIYYGKIDLGEIPMLTMAMRENKTIAAMYSAVLFFAVFSTALSNGIGAVNIIGGRIGRKRAAAIIAFAGFCMSGAGFSSLIDAVYRTCGYVGAFFLVYVICHYILFAKKMKKEDNRRKQKEIG